MARIGRIVLGSSREANICFLLLPSAIHNVSVSGQRTEGNSRVQDDAGCSCSYAGSWRPLPSYCLLLQN